MKLTVKLYAGLGQYLPDGCRNHTIELDLDAPVSPNTVLAHFGVPREAAHLVLVNGVYIRPQDRDSAGLHDGDTVAAWPPVAGG